MNRRVAGAVAAFLVGVGVAGCDDGRVAISRDDLPSVPAAATVTVTLGPDGFSPGALRVTTDDLVAFVVTVDRGGIRTADDGINSGPLLAGESTEVVFDTAGRYELLDLTDDGRSIVVEVTDSDD